MRALYTDIAGAAAAVSAIMAQAATPRVLEFMDGASIRLARDAAALEIPDAAGAMLIIEYDGQAETLCGPTTELSCPVDLFDHAGPLTLQVLAESVDGVLSGASTVPVLVDPL